MAKAQSTISPEISDLYDQLIATQPSIKRKGKNNPYTSLNGHMFSFISKENTICMRLSKEDWAAFREKFNVGDVIQYGAVMRGYVEMPPEVEKDLELMVSYLQKSYDYIASLEPKPTKKKK